LLPLALHLLICAFLQHRTTPLIQAISFSGRAEGDLQLHANEYAIDLSRIAPIDFITERHENND